MTKSYEQVTGKARGHIFIYLMKFDDPDLPANIKLEEGKVYYLIINKGDDLQEYSSHLDYKDGLKSYLKAVEKRKAGTL